MKSRNIVILTGLIIILPLCSTTAITQKSELVCNEIVTARSFDSDIIDMINMVNGSLVREYLEKQVAFGPRPTGSENCSMAADYLYNEFKKMGLNVEFDPFKFLRCKGKNIIATLNGTDSSSDAVFILCSHYDTWENSPGANDDASGVAAVMAIAKIMSQYSFNHTIKFILFSGHETGAYGSLAYAQQAYFDDENIVAVLVLGSIGRVGKNGDAIHMSRTYRTDWILHLTQEISNTFMKYVNLLVEPVPVWSADNRPFEKYGFSATIFTPGEQDPPDHCPEDNIERINFSYLVKVTKLMLITTIELVNRPIDVQVRFVTPYEGCFYFSDKLFFKLPGYNLISTGLQGITYIGSRFVIARVNITTTEEINEVIFTIDKKIRVNGICKEPPYEWMIRKTTLFLHPFFGKHTLEVTVTTMGGKTAYDEMDIFII